MRGGSRPWKRGWSHAKGQHAGEADDALVQFFRRRLAAVRIVHTLRTELGTDRGTAQRIARQLGYGAESVRSCVRQADIDEGQASEVSTDRSSSSPTACSRIAPSP